jgi:uncharacterized protein YjiS (DUF1127 family)
MNGSGTTTRRFRPAEPTTLEDTAMKAVMTPTAVARPARLSRPRGPAALIADAVSWTVAYNTAWRGRRQLAELPAERLWDAGLTEAEREELLSIALTEDPVFRTTREQVRVQFYGWLTR